MIRSRNVDYDCTGYTAKSKVTRKPVAVEKVSELALESGMQLTV